MQRGSQVEQGTHASIPAMTGHQAPSGQSSPEAGGAAGLGEWEGQLDDSLHEEEKQAQGQQAGKSGRMEIWVWGLDT